MSSDAARRPAEPEADRAVGSPLWLYTNFDCNLQCAYCCVRSSPKAPRRPLGLERVRRIAERSAQTRREGNLRHRRRAFRAARHWRHRRCVRRGGADHGAHQRHAVLRPKACRARVASARPGDACRSASTARRRNGTTAIAGPRRLGARPQGNRDAPARKGSASGSRRPSPTTREAEEFRVFLDARGRRRAGPGRSAASRCGASPKTASRLPAPISSLRSRSPRTASTGIRSGPRTRTCSCARRSFRWRSLSPRCARPSSGKASIARRLAQIFNCA